LGYININNHFSGRLIINYVSFVVKLKHIKFTWTNSKYHSKYLHAFSLRFELKTNKYGREYEIYIVQIILKTNKYGREYEIYIVQII